MNAIAKLSELAKLCELSSHASSLAAAEAISWWWRAVTLSDYNTRVVLGGTVSLGIAAGLAGVFLLLRKRALLGDAISHATLPGVSAVFLWSIAVDVPKTQVLLLIGAAISGALGGVCVLGLRHWVRVREDAALGIVLSVFFGLGVALIGIVIQLPGGNAAGLESFIYGKMASITWFDARLCAALAIGILALLVMFFKELKILCFDSELAQSQGWPVQWLDLLLVGMVVTVTIFGLRAVGLIMVIALLIVPAAAARFWSNSLRTILCVSASIGGTSCAVGTLVSVSVERLPSGALVVLVSSLLFLISFLLGRERGYVWSLIRSLRLRQQQEQQHLLRSIYELLEALGKLDMTHAVRFELLRASELLTVSEVALARGWTRTNVRRIARPMERLDLVTLRPDDQLQLTPRGLLVARRIVREHRLLERFFIDHTDVSEAEADRGADLLEHSLAPELLRELGSYFSDLQEETLPASPHPLRSQKEKS